MFSSGKGHTCLQLSKTVDMAFGQQLGPPASAKQLQELLSLLRSAGHTDFRDARGPMGFTQRQAAGKFTRSEASDFIEQLQDAESLAEGSLVEGPLAEDTESIPTRSLSTPQELLSRMPAERLAEELERRGWVVIPGPPP